ncbi:uncharacterized protein [Branchiostoma lanceolatum]|uniref:uncharacterized protein n=1 Tax=Branchiostoma lanceolatum TaxID=7740 RepID=UPI003456584E
MWTLCCDCWKVTMTKTSLHTVFIIVIASPLMTGIPVPEGSGTDLEILCHPCPPGTFMEDTCLPGKPDTATCTPCPDGTYRRRPNHARFCHPHKTSCDAPYQIREPVQPGDRTHDAVCHCEHRAVKVTNNKCVKRKNCPPGKGITKGGRCKQCEEGTFSDKISKFQKCQPISNCSQQGRETVHPGSVTSDARCGDLLSPKSVADMNENQISIDDMIQKHMEDLTAKDLLQNIKKVHNDALAPESYAALAEKTTTTASRTHNTDAESLTIAMNTLQRHTKTGKIAIHDEDGHIDFIENGVIVVPSTENYDSFTLDAQHIKLSSLEELLKTTSSPVFAETPADNTTQINLIVAITTACFLASVICISFLVVAIRYLKILVKQKNLEATPLIEGRLLEEGDIGENTGYQEDIEEDVPLLSQEPEPCTEPSSPHADLQEPPLGAEGIKEDVSSKKEAEVQIHVSPVPSAVVRPKQRSLSGQPHATPSEEDSPQYTGSIDDETVPLLLRGSQDVSSPMDPVFKPEGLEGALHPTPPLKDDAESHSSMTVDATEPSIPQESLPSEPEELQEDEEQPTEDVPDGPSDAGPMSQPKELRTEEEDEEEETSLKQTSGSPEDDEDIPDIEEIARTAMVRVPSDELSFPVQESAHESDGLEALGAVGGRSGSFSPLPSAEADSDAESSSGDEAYERKVRVAIRDSVAKSLFTGLAHHLSNPAGPGPDWVPLARAAGITGPEIDHIINEAAQDLDKDIRKMLEQYEEGKTGDRPISELYGELIARKRQQLYNTFRRDPPS